MVIRVILTSLMSLVILAASRGGGYDQKTAQETVRQQYPSLREVNAPLLRGLSHASLKRLFPDYHFFAAIARQFPIAVVVPKGLKTQNLFVVHGKEVSHLTSAKELQAFFRRRLPGVTSDDAARAAVRAWLVLAPEFNQDGFYEFQLDEDSLKVVPLSGGRKATGKTIVMRGGNGQITAALVFDANGRLLSAKQSVQLRPGPRPICQATKLLDPDPIVRRMAEQDLLIMGRAAEGYLQAQRQRAEPKLRRAIDRLWDRIVTQPE